MRLGCFVAGALKNGRQRDLSVSAQDDAGGALETR